MPATSKIQDMKDAMFKMAKEAVDTAAKLEVNVFCFQEAWSKFLSFFFIGNSCQSGMNYNLLL